MAGILQLNNGKVVSAEAVDLKNLNLSFSLPIAAVATTTAPQTVTSLKMTLQDSNWVALFFDLDYLLSAVLVTTALSSVILTVTATSNYDPTTLRTVYSKTFTLPSLSNELTFMTIDEPTFYPCNDINTVTYTVNIAISYVATVADAVTLSYNGTGAKMFLIEELNLDKALMLALPV